MSLSPGSVIHYEGFKCFPPGSGGSDPSDPSSGHEGPQPPDLARSKHFTLTLDTPGLVTRRHHPDPEAEEDANRKQNLSVFFLVVDNNF